MIRRRDFLASTTAASLLALTACRDGAPPVAPVTTLPSPPPPPPAPAHPETTFVSKRRIGRSDISIAPLVLGGNVFGWTADKARSFELLDRFLDAGLETIDTADIYSAWVPGNSGGESESIIGEWMQRRGNRDRIVVITKVGGEFDGNKGLSAAHIARSAEASLKRLQTDYIDVYFSHFFDAETPHEETLAAYDALIRAGKVRIIGASNFDAAQTRAALEASAANNLPRYELLQPRYNLYDRSDFEGPLRELAIAESLGVITYSSLASGFLTGKYRSESDLGQSPRGRGVARYLDERGLRILDALDAVAKLHDAAMAEVALAWVMAQPGITAPIASATSIEQLDSLARAVTLRLTDDEVASLDAASRT
ncbi:aldo/keto reductase [Xanthomonadaceae bacterium JHOS43]|nr:aldo/keto reductase [Xanthomonadaceae bacterium JHOS43]